MASSKTVVLAGNPNSGKTTLFNQLTGARQRTANYPGITVTHTVGSYRTTGGDEHQIVDLPGTYSLSALSPEEEVGQRFILGDGDGERDLDLIGCVADATNLERNLYLTSQLSELGLPTVVFLNMMDVANDRGLRIDQGALSERLGVPVVGTVAHDRETLPDVERAIESALSGEQGDWGSRRFRFDDSLEGHIADIAQTITDSIPDLGAGEVDFLARRTLGDTKTPLLKQLRAMPAVAVHRTAFRDAHGKLDIDELEIQLRYAWIREILSEVLERPANTTTVSDRIDRVVLNRWAGPAILAAVFSFLFVTVFIVAAYPADWIEAGKGWLVGAVGGALPNGELSSLITDGVIEGVGAVVVFVPQIMLLFLLVALLEDFGYMSRAAFTLDRLLSRVGLSGRAFVPLLSSFACAIPGVLATRTIPSRRERFQTILIAPLMVCSARLPVYSILIAAFIVPAHGAVTGAVTFVALYVVGVVAAAVVALLLNRTLFRGEREPLLLELPDYRRPSWRNIGIVTWERTWDFLRNAGTIILSISIVLWFLATHPKADDGPDEPMADSGAAASAALDDIATNDALPLEDSYAGRFGKFIEPTIEPLGYDWKIGIGLLTSFAAREVFVGTMSTLYGLQEDDEAASARLVDRLRNDTNDEGGPRYSLLTALSLLLFYAFACQCISTLAVVSRETRSWRWAGFMFVYMTGLAYGSALVLYQGGRLLGLD